MLAFIIPFKPKTATKNWDFDNLLLKRTLNSICQQTDQNYKVYISCTDLPTFHISSKKVEVLRFLGKRLTAEEIIHDKRLGFKEIELLEARMDKGKKIHLGVEKAAQEKCSYVMVVDSDDCLSNDISAFVQANGKTDHPGWFIDKGYVYEEGKDFLIKKNKNFNYLNGSTHIINMSLIPRPDLNSCAFSDFAFFQAHGYLKKRIKNNHNAELLPLPFYGVIYIAHQTNNSQIRKIYSAKTFKRILVALIYFKRRSKFIVDKFGLYKIYPYNE